MDKGLTKFLLVVGFLSLLHAAYSAAQRKQINQFTTLCMHIIEQKINVEFVILDRTYLRDTDQERTNTFLPLDVSILKNFFVFFLQD